MVKQIPQSTIAILSAMIRALAGAYGLSIVLFLLFRSIIGDDWVVLAFFNSFGHLLLLPGFVLLPIIVMLREWRIALMLLPGVIVFGIIYGGQFVNISVKASASADTITLLTYNLAARNQQYEAVIDLIRDSDADIVMLQELSLNLAQELETALAHVYPYRELHTSLVQVQGQGILSRYPIISDEYWQYDWLPTPLAHQRAILQLTDGTEIVLFNSHFTHPGMNNSVFNPKWRSREIAELLVRVRRENDPVIWAGDFNLPDLADDYAAIASNYHDAYRTVGWGMGWTFPVTDAFIPFLRLDYVFYSDQFQALSAQTGASSAGSDHLPLLVHLLVTDQ